MKSRFDMVEVHLSCLSCRNEMLETLGCLKEDNEVICDICGAMTAVKGNVLVQIEADLARQIDSLVEFIRKFDKH